MTNDTVEHVTGIRWFAVGIGGGGRVYRSRGIGALAKPSSVYTPRDPTVCQRPAHKNIRRAKNEKKCTHTHTHAYIYTHGLI
jgi:hypothetical protein